MSTSSSASSLRVGGIGLVVLAAVLAVVGAVALGGGSDSSGASEASSSTAAPAEPSSAQDPSETSSAEAQPSTEQPTTEPPSTTTPTSTAPPESQLLPSAQEVPTATMGAVAARATVGVTVLNNSEIRGLGDNVAEDLRGFGWRVNDIQNLPGRNRVITVYYRPGTTEETAAEFLAADVGAGAVQARPLTLDPLPAGLLLVVTKDYEAAPKGS